MSDNKNLHKAKNVKNDIWYTRLDDIEEELKHYRKHFKDKVVFCNCDDPYESNFFKYFVLHFNQLKLKKLICTCYSGSPIMGEQISLFDVAKGDNKTPYKAEVTKVYDITGDGAISMDDIKELFIQGENSLTELEGNGDFRSDECVEILKEADIVVTNPPFSLFREYVAQLMDYGKKFLIIGTMNAITYKEIFPLLRDDKMWVGYNSPKEFIQPDKTVKKFGNILWYTNLDIKKRHEETILYRKYDPEIYPKYNNYDAVNVDATADIPCDFDGVMGVPITFMVNCNNPDQFEIVGMAHGNMGQELGVSANLTDEQCAEYFAKNKAFRRGFVCYTKDNALIVPYMRILIRNKHPETTGGDE